MLSTIGSVVLLASLFFASADAYCPANAEFTTSAECDYVCGVDCDYKGVKNICICNLGYLKDPSTGNCVLEDQCPGTVTSQDVPVLRSIANDFVFSCFTV